MAPLTIRIGILCIALFSSAALHAQRFENVRATFQNGTVNITYDLVGTGSSPRKFNVEIFGSHNNYSAPLKAVVGDVGKGVNPGLSRQIQWNAAAELGTYNGDVVFRLRGEPMPIPFSFTSPKTSVRRGKNAQITWVGGPVGQQVKLEVIQNGSIINTISTGTSNNGSFTWQVPADLPKGAYNLKISGGAETAQSNTIKVKSKLPMFLIVAPIVVVGIIIAVLPKKDKDDPGGADPTSEDLPDAPGPK
jgi:membrane-associated protease RseP (regulator of RpoE activity)